MWSNNIPRYDWDRQTPRMRSAALLSNRMRRSNLAVSLTSRASRMTSLPMSTNSSLPHEACDFAVEIRPDRISQDPVRGGDADGSATEKISDGMTCKIPTVKRLLIDWLQIRPVFDEALVRGWVMPYFERLGDALLQEVGLLLRRYFPIWQLFGPLYT